MTAASLETRSELLKLARALGTDPEQLDFLAAAAAPDVRRLRDDVAEALFDADRVHFERVAVLAAKVPRGLSSQLAQHALGARMAARAAGLLDPAVAADLARRLPTPFLADVASHSDPRRLVHLLAHLPVDQLVDVTRELVVRAEWLTMGAFVGHLTDAALDAALEVLDGEALLRTGFVMDEKARVGDVLERLGDERVLELLDAAARHGLWVEAFELSLHASEAQQARLAAGLDALDDARLRELGAAVAADPALADAATGLAELASPRVRELVGA